MSSECWVLQHGWGFDHQCWNSWKQVIPANVELHMLDRGYFGCPKSQPVSAAHVVVVHSFGLHLIPEIFLQKAHCLVILAGFISFPCSGGIQGGSNEYNIMLTRLPQAPESVIHRFQRNCFYPSEFISREQSGILGLSLLTQDLFNLGQSKFDLSLIAHIPKILIFHGSQDQIVPHRTGEELHRCLPQSKFISIENAGHALPFEHATLCCAAIANMRET